MPNLQVTDKGINAALQALIDLIDVGGTGEIFIYDGTQPPNPNSIITDQTLLLRIGFIAPAFNSPVAGVSVANSMVTGIGLAVGNATWARIVDGNDEAVFDCDVGTVGTTIILDTVVIAIDDLIGLTSFNLTLPNGT